jgi:hypothetical protein
MKGYYQDIDERRNREGQNRLRRGIERYVALVDDNRRRMLAVSGGVLFVALMSVLVWVVFFQTRTVDLEIAELTWSRGVEIEEYRTIRTGGWHAPSDAYNVATSRRTHHYDRVLDHMETRYRSVQYQSGSTTETYSCGTTSNGNGTYTTNYCTRTVPQYSTRQEPYQEAVYRDEPVYETWYEYDVDRWTRHHWEREHGDDDDRPHWPGTEQFLNQGTELGALRVGRGRQEAYAVRLVDPDGKSHPKEVDLTTWDRLREGRMVRGQVNRRGDVRSVDWLGENV